MEEKKKGYKKNIMKLVYKFRYPKSIQLDILCHISKKLYNQANFYMRQDYFHLNNKLSYFDLNFMLRNSTNYKLLKVQSAQ